jgi:hypothetical membrane protein
MKYKMLIYFGFVIPLVFWLTIIISGLMTENYSHLTNMVSELGTIGTKTQYIFTAGLVLSSVLSVFFVIGLYKTAKEYRLNIFPILILLTFSFSIFGAGIFPLPLRLHGVLGSPSMLLPLSPLLALIIWSSKTIPGIKFASGLMLFIIALGFLAFMPNVLSDYTGLKQRFFHVGWTVWFIYLTQRFLKLNMHLKQQESPASNNSLHFVN